MYSINIYLFSTFFASGFKAQVNTMLKRIHIDNYKCLTNFDLRFGELTLLLGANGCGKSAVFEIMGKLRDFIRGDARVGELFSAADITHWSRIGGWLWRHSAADHIDFAPS